MDHHQLISNRIMELAKQRGLSVNKLALASELTQSTLAGLLSGKGRVPKADTLYSICDGLNISVMDFFDFTPYNQRPDGTSAAKQRDKWEQLGDALTPEEQERVRRILTGKNQED